MIHINSAEEYRRLLIRLWNMLGCGAPHPGSLLKINKQNGRVVGLLLENVVFALDHSGAKVKLYHEEHAAPRDSSHLTVLSHSHHYQPGATEGERQHAFRIDKDGTGLHGNTDDKMIHGRVVKHRYEPNELTLDIRDFNAVLFMLVVAKYRATENEYPFFPEYGQMYNELLAQPRERLSNHDV